jgi:hypothetical protein
MLVYNIFLSTYFLQCACRYPFFCASLPRQRKGRVGRGVGVVESEKEWAGERAGEEGDGDRKEKEKGEGEGQYEGGGEGIKWKGNEKGKNPG